MTQRTTQALVAHLFRRAGFGLRPDELTHFTRLGVAGSVDYLIDYTHLADPAEQQYPPPDLSQFTTPEIPKDQRTVESQRAQGKLRAEAKLAIQTWWINRMLTTSRPLQEKMVLFWHGHFATGITKARAEFMLQQNQLFRSMALGNFNALLKAVNQDPAMLLWLDGGQNRKGKPNENFARELMELFTIGVGNFTEQDVREGARALTGWVIRRARAVEQVSAGPVQAHLAPRLHDDGVKTYLGHTGNLGSDDVMNILSAHPAAGTFIVGKLFRFFAYDNAPAAILQPFVDTYYHSNHDIRAVVRQILLSDAFYSDQAFQAHIKSPAEFVVGTVRELNTPVPAAKLVRAMVLMGQDLFNPPNVGGWPGGFSWVNASTLVARFNFAGTLTARTGVEGNAITPQQLVQQSGAHDALGLVDYLLTRFVGVGATPATRAELVDYLGGPLSPGVIETRVRGLLQLVVSTPEYQLN